MNKILAIIFIFMTSSIFAQKLQVGVETNVGVASTSFKGDLSEMFGFAEIEVTGAVLDSALAQIDVTAPRWLKDAFRGAKIDIEGDINKKVNRNIKSVRFFVRYDWIGASFTVSDPRLTEPQESRKLKNQAKAVRLALSGDAEGITAHLAKMALADETRVKPFFSSRYDIEFFLNFKRLFLKDYVLISWGKNNSISFDVNAGMRFTADPSAVVDLGSILFVRDKLDDLMEGGILKPVENTTDKIAVAIQNVVFGKFRDPRVVPSLGGFVRGEVPISFGENFTLLGGVELSTQKHIAIKGTQPMTSLYGYLGFRWGLWSSRR